MHTTYKRLQRLAGVSLVVTAAFLSSGCFHILHYVNKDDAGVVSVFWRFTLSAAMGEMMAADEAPAAGAEGERGPQIQHRFDEVKEEMRERFSGKVENLVLRSISNNQDVGMMVSFESSEGAAVSAESEFPILPEFSREPAPQMLFRFKSDGQRALSPDGGDSQQQDEMSRNIARLFLSTARYQIVLGEGYRPTRAFLVAANGEEMELDIVRLGKQSMIDFPFLAMETLTGNEDYDLIVMLSE